MHGGPDGSLLSEYNGVSGKQLLNEDLKVWGDSLNIKIYDYEPRQITDAELDAVLEAGTYAASAMGRQSAKIVVVQDAATRAQLTRMNAPMLFSVIEVCHNRVHLCNDYSHITSKYDISLVCETQGNRHHEHKNIIWWDCHHADSESQRPCRYRPA